MTLVVEPGWKVGLTLSATDIAANPKLYYGMEVEGYEPPNGDPVGWKVFYSDSEYIYLVADDYIHYDYAPKGKDGTTTLYKRSDGYQLSFDNLRKIYDGSADILNPSITDPRVLTYLTWVNSNKTDTDTNIKSVAYMVDTVRWNEKYKNSTYGAYAIGGPTIEMFIKSYNQVYPEKGLTYSITGTSAADGYRIGTGGAPATSSGVAGLDTSNSLYVISADDRKCNNWWLASPSPGAAFIFYVSSTGAISNTMYSLGNTGFRPLVCLRKGVDLLTLEGQKMQVLIPRVDVVAKQDTLEITQGDSNVFDSLFTVTTRDGGTATKTYTLNGTTTNIRNTSELPVGTHTITCTATYNGTSESASMTLVVKAKVTVPLERTTLYNLDTIDGTSKTITFTVPNGVTVLELFVGMMAWDDYEGYTWVGHDSVEWWSGYAVDGEQNYCMNKYIKVTPGKNYTLTIDACECETWMGIYYSQSINNESPNMTDL